MLITPENNKGETSTCRHSLARWCVGSGVDIGFGGHAPIVDTALTSDQYPAPWFGSGWPNQLCLDAFCRLPFSDNSLDYIYSSHCLEDAIDTAGVLSDWCRVLRPGGVLVLFLPDQKTYEADCAKKGTEPNPDHKHWNFGMEYTISCLPNTVKVIHKAFPLDYNPYSFELVAMKL
jgi:SAM-dependent methyltransferase